MRRLLNSPPVLIAEVDMVDSTSPVDSHCGSLPFPCQPRAYSTQLEGHLSLTALLMGLVPMALDKSVKGKLFEAKCPPYLHKWDLPLVHPSIESG